jgi:predicted dithiol-disulfide oxidoreductase (DUF899 family)
MCPLCLSSIALTVCGVGSMRIAGTLVARMYLDLTPKGRNENGPH